METKASPTKSLFKSAPQSGQGSAAAPSIPNQPRPGCGFNGRLTFFKVLLLSFLSLMFLAVASIMAAYIYYVPEPPSADEAEAFSPPSHGFFLGGEIRVIGEFYRSEKLVLGLDEIPADLKNAFLACEDSGFYEAEAAIKLPFGQRSRRSVFNDIIYAFRGGDPLKGCSSIAQQAVRLSLDDRKTDRRKLRLSPLVVLKAERRLSRDEIFHYYLNRVHLGRGCRGVQAASLFYFNKTADKLTLAESALLAGLARNPGRNRLQAPEYARNRMSVVLNRMKWLGFISDEEAEEALKMEVIIGCERRPPDFMRAAPGHILLPKLGGNTILLSGPFILH